MGDQAQDSVTTGPWEGPREQAVEGARVGVGAGACEAQDQRQCPLFPFPGPASL